MANAGGSVMFVEKYRPSRIEELISHQDILSTREEKEKKKKKKKKKKRKEYFLEKEWTKNICHLFVWRLTVFKFGDGFAPFFFFFF